MATCPNCGRSLHARHRCTGVWRLRAAVYARVLAGGVLTALAGGLVVQVIYGSVSLSAMVLSGVAGGVVTWAFLRGEPPFTRA